MSQPSSERPGRGYVIEASWVPGELPARLEREGLAVMTAHTVDGVYVELRTSVATIVAAFEAAGARVRGFRAAGAPASWHDTARPAARAMERLRNRRSAEWLPTLPAA